MKKLQLGIYKHKQLNIFYDHPIESYIISLSDKICIYKHMFTDEFDYYLMSERKFDLDDSWEKIENCMTEEKNESCFCNE